MKLPEMCIKLYGLDKTKLVLDPPMDIRTTAGICREPGVDHIESEIGPNYIAGQKFFHKTLCPRIYIEGPGRRSGR